MSLALLPEEIEMLKSVSIERLHKMIIERTYDHGDLERIIHERIKAIPRLPLGRDGRWWSFPQANSYPYND